MYSEYDYVMSSSSTKSVDGDFSNPAGFTAVGVDENVAYNAHEGMVVTENVSYNTSNMMRSIVAVNEETTSEAYI